MTIDIAALEKTGQTIVDSIIAHEAIINMVSGMVGILPEVAIAERGLPLISGILQYMQGQSGKSLIDVFQEWVSHQIPGMPNSPILSGPSNDLNNPANPPTP